MLSPSWSTILLLSPTREAGFICYLPVRALFSYVIYRNHEIPDVISLNHCIPYVISLNHCIPYVISQSVDRIFHVISQSVDRISMLSPSQNPVVVCFSYVISQLEHYFTILSPSWSTIFLVISLNHGIPYVISLNHGMCSNWEIT